MNLNNHITKTLLNEYAGSEKKKTVLMDDGNKYLLKFPDPIREKGKDLSYINNAISEYISCSIYNIIGISAQKTILGEYIDEKGKQKIACACQDVRKNGEMMYEINKLELSSLDNTHARTLSFSYMDEVFNKMDDTISKELLSDFYYKMFIVDAFIGNTDRHNGNWALLQSSDDIRISPVYDCGSSLAPLVDESVVSSDAGVKCAMNTSSVLVDDKGKRIKYCEFFKNELSPRVQKALLQVVPNINLDEVDKLVFNTEYISKNRQDFYFSFLHTTYEKILIPAIERCFTQPEISFSDLTPDKCYDFYKTIIRPLKENATYQKQSLDFIGLKDYQYSKGGKGKIFIYKNEDVVGLISSRSNNKETRENYAKLSSFGLNIEKAIKSIKIKQEKTSQAQIEKANLEMHKSEELFYNNDSHDDFEER
ncbi:HipA domain-containing protein [Blautia obeum]|uniref:HipA domain-containing protein n=1 Tax=Blautia obeum TaxID=40520 RepID=UPI002109D191|nr:HipA domain-containing protein [Blautia obeum]MCQ4791122.1 HipA domain-containing protein [Blautia obeum]